MRKERKCYIMASLKTKSKHYNSWHLYIKQPGRKEDFYLAKQRHLGFKKNKGRCSPGVIPYVLLIVNIIMHICHCFVLQLGVSTKLLWNERIEIGYIDDHFMRKTGLKIIQKKSSVLKKSSRTFNNKQISCSMTALILYLKTECLYY